MQYRKQKRYLYSLVFSLIIGFSGNAQAACKSSDMSGTWIGDIFFVAGGFGAWLHCRMPVDSTGRFRRSNSVCVDDFFGLNLSVAGQFRLTPGCFVKTTRVDFFLTPTGFGTFLGFSTINFLNLNTGKNVMIGAGDRFSSSPFIVNAVKR